MRVLDNEDNSGEHDEGENAERMGREGQRRGEDEDGEGDEGKDKDKDVASTSPQRGRWVGEMDSRE